MDRGGFVSSILYVDLTSGKIWREPLSLGDAEGFIGGGGINSRLAYELIRPGVDPLGPDNALIYGAGPMVGTMVPGMARTVITALSPQTGYLGSSAAGHFGAMLKFAGYDHVVIMGQAARPVYLRIFDDDVALVDASSLWGKDIYETCDFFWQQYPEVWVNCIGPAGENLVSYAVIVSNKFSTYGSTGLGAVMGSKRLKAVVAKGSKQVPVADPPAFMRLVDRTYRELVASPYGRQWRELGTLIQFQEYAPGANEKMERREFDMPGWTRIYKEKLWKGSITCPSCPIGCKARLETDWGKYSGMTVSASCPAGTVTLPFAQTMGLPADRPDEILKCSELCNRLGISTVAVATVIDAFVHMYEDGSVDQGDTGGVELRRGEPALVHRLLGMIAHREGFGDLMAERFGDALSKLGKETRFAAFRQEPWEKGKPVYWDQMYETASTAYRRGYNGFTFGALVDPRRTGPPNAYSNITMMPGRS
ncbi:MAG: aldehyde ferredoxin oxidoreductase N-terminal domain-containing protein, partial [Dehalococcoidia bacterium]|nr:aldehyde ferredoxin oxidoreductase N-terminal domain-containing protein [Dehalococcoidia bacterium]